MTVTGHVVLVGLPGSGKSTLAPLLATALSRPSVDVDAEIEHRTGATIATLIRDRGEAHFRELERTLVEEVITSPSAAVVAAGGGLVAQPGMVEWLARRATVVWLDAPDEELLHRLGTQASLRPLLEGDPYRALERLRASRAHAHQGAALHVATAGQTPQEVASELAGLLDAAVRVGTPQPYLVDTEPGSLRRIESLIPSGARRLVLVGDRAVQTLLDRLTVQLAARFTVVPVALAAGEDVKQWTVVGSLLEHCARAGLERGDCLVAVGGGSVGDAAGFAAATYMRGIPWVVVPTTLLAMVDSAIGGKTAVNLGGAKNLAGAFWQPRGVVCDVTTLATLPDRPFRSAFAEVVKTLMLLPPAAAAAAEAALPAALERDPQALGSVVRACCAFKAGVVAADERELGLRAILNYGHTVGHAVEAAGGLGSGLDHGEAVSVGLRVAGVLSVRHAGCPPAAREHQDALLDACGLSVRPRMGAAEIVARLRWDKKTRAGVPRWVLLRDRGEPVTGIVLEPAAVEAAVRETVGS